MNELLLPSEARRRALLAEMEADKQAKTPEKEEVLSERRKSALNERFPFLTKGECEGKDDHWMEDMNRIRKIMWFYEQPVKYREIVKQYPEQKHYKDKFNYEEDDITKGDNSRKSRTGRKKGGNRTWFD